MLPDPNNLKTVNAGEPVTAQGWNTIVTGLAGVTDFLLTTEAGSLQATITNQGVDPAKARVFAIRDDGVTFLAVPPVGAVTNYVFTGIRPGSYTIRAEAPGFTAATKSVVAPSANVISLTLTPNGAFMPQVFGTLLPAALQALKNLNIAVSRVLDVAGRDVAPANPSADYNNAPVLVQIPAAGQPVPPQTSVQLVVATSLQVQPAVQVPPLTGLTLSEAQKALEALGLKLGKVTTKKKAG